MQGLIRLLSTCASGSDQGAKTLLLLGISGILKDILSGSGLVAGMSVSPALSRPAEQVLADICLEAFFFKKPICSLPCHFLFSVGKKLFHQLW